MVLHVHGHPLGGSEVELLIRVLRQDGAPAAVEAAGTIIHAYANDRFAAQLSFETREAILFVLAVEDDLPDGLDRLRETLSRHVVALVEII
jgi:hypothetical protein